jgi:hypothetical protein
MKVNRQMLLFVGLEFFGQCFLERAGRESVLASTNGFGAVTRGKGTSSAWIFMAAVLMPRPNDGTLVVQRSKFQPRRWKHHGGP